MSAFDSIKYPLSDKPTAEEIEAIPNAIAFWWAITHPILFVKLIFHLRYNTPIDDEVFTKTLRKAIFTYGETPIQKIKRWCSK